MWSTRNLPSHTRPWNADDIDQMAELLALGHSIPEVAAKLGRTQEAVRNRARALDMLPKRERRSAPILTAP